MVNTSAIFCENAHLCRKLGLQISSNVQYRSRFVVLHSVHYARRRETRRVIIHGHSTHYFQKKLLSSQIKLPPSIGWMTHTLLSWASVHPCESATPPPKQVMKLLPMQSLHITALCQSCSSLHIWLICWSDPCYYYALGERGR